MKMDKWTKALAAAGVVSLASTAQAEENSVLTALSSTMISGSVEASYHGTFSRANNLLDDQGFNIDGANLVVESPLGEGDWSAGYRVELLLGERAQNFGMVEGEDFLIKNANIGLNLPVGNGVDLTLGLFDTIVGYEVEASVANPNYQRSYGYDLEPFTHTGLLASTSLMDGVSLSLGLANAFDSTGDLHNGTIDGDGNFAYLAGVEVVLPDSMSFLGGSSVYAAVVDGAGEGADNDDDDQLFYVGASINTPIDGVALGGAYDQRTYANNTQEDAIAGYLLWDATEKSTVALRADFVDWADDSAQQYTLTLSYELWENVNSRLEYGYETGNAAKGEDSSYIAANLYYQF